MNDLSTFGLIGVCNRMLLVIKNPGFMSTLLLLGSPFLVFTPVTIFFSPFFDQKTKLRCFFMGKIFVAKPCCIKLLQVHDVVVTSNRHTGHICRELVSTTGLI